ncbi:unannotated protein [freshwater metagenome]|uniref:Unannotated protein n=1 Tax=freshwater metagenome TaxID=449393 RepID=A0A6J7C6N9_9ZZZZ
MSFAQVVSCVIVLGSWPINSDSWEKNRLPNTARKAIDAIMIDTSTMPVAAPRRIPWLASQVTPGSIAIESSQASSNMKRNRPSEANAHSATWKVTKIARRVTALRRSARDSKRTGTALPSDVPARAMTSGS